MNTKTPSPFILPVQSVGHTVDDEDFEFFREEIRNLAGIWLSDAKKELLQSRLRSRVQTLGFTAFKAYRVYLEQLPRSHTEWQEFINLLTTNKTDWFREPAHFEYLLKEYIPKWKLKGKKTLSIWIAASSTGEEAYTLSMVLNRVLPPMGITYEILSTDIDTEVLRHAQNGVYRNNCLDQIPKDYHADAFLSGSGEISNWIKVRSHIKLPIKFEQFNLMTSTYPWKGKFDIIFCRNVLIYFPKETVAEVVQKLFHTAKPEGILLIGHSESVHNMAHSWTYVKPSILKRASNP